MVRRWLGLFALITVGGAAMPAIGHGMPAPRFTRVARGGVASVAAAGRWVFYITNHYARDSSGHVYATGASGTLLDERSGRRRILHPPGCGLLEQAMIGGPWLYIDCVRNSGMVVPSPLLYNLSSHKWTTVRIDTSGSGGGPCTEAWDLGGGCSVIGIGRFFIELQIDCEHCVTAYAVQPIPSGGLTETTTDGAVRRGGRAAFDLNSRRAVQPLCSPLTYPGGPSQYSSGEVIQAPGWMLPLGRFALVADAPAKVPLLVPRSDDRAYLERCGSRSRIRLPAAWGVAVSSRAVAWTAAKIDGTAKIDGIRLPSLRRFSIPTPAGARFSASAPIALSATRVYLVDKLLGRGTLWSAPLKSS